MCRRIGGRLLGDFDPLQKVLPNALLLGLYVHGPITYLSRGPALVLGSDGNKGARCDL